MPQKNLQPCRICGSPTFRKWRSSLLQPPNSRSFAITDFNFGRISALYQCGTCGFRQCHDLTDVLSFYKSQEDPAYEDGRKQRKLQAQALLKRLGQYMRKGRLLDVGAGSGILVEAARAEGFQARGVAPSRWLQGQAERRGLRVEVGLLVHTISGETSLNT
ncbi:MAG: methyltransferase domain-containing protein [Opitutae bacterium]|nr:methyltransferase domain-containing protein [Opitutae bacterium]